jgi:hypothetical protein
MSPLIRRAIRVSGKAKAGGGLEECRRQLGGGLLVLPRDGVAVMRRTNGPGQSNRESE